MRLRASEPSRPCIRRPQNLEFPPVGIFADLDSSELEALAKETETRALRRGDVLVRQGDPADDLFIVLTGRFAVTKEGRRDPIAEIGPEQPIGEIAFLTGGTRTATVTAMRDSVVLRLSRNDFDLLTAKCPSIWRTLTNTLSHRLAATTGSEPQRSDPRPRTITLIRAGEAAIPPEFIRQFTDAFAAASAMTFVIDAAKAEKLLPKGVALDSAEATQLFNELESKYDYLIFIADPELTPWSQKAIRHADLVLGVGVHAANPNPNRLEQHVAEFVLPEARRLVLLHPHARADHGDRALAALALGRHAPPRRARYAEATSQRLFRFVNGTALGLVACGGGALCAAHVGLYKALIESGLEFDIMGGTSARRSHGRRLRHGQAPRPHRRRHARHLRHQPRHAALHAGRATACSITATTTSTSAAIFVGINIEDLWIPYFAVSTNLSRYELHRHDRGDLFAGDPRLGLDPGAAAAGLHLEGRDAGRRLPARQRAHPHDAPDEKRAQRRRQLSTSPSCERFDVEYAKLPSRNELVRMTLNPFGHKRLPDAPGLTTVLMRSLMANRNDFNRQLSRTICLWCRRSPRTQASSTGTATPSSCGTPTGGGSRKCNGCARRSTRSSNPARRRNFSTEARRRPQKAPRVRAARSEVSSRLCNQAN